MSDNSLSKLLLSLMLFLTGSLLAFMVFCMFKFGFIQTVGWCTVVYFIFFALCLLMRDTIDRGIGEK
jgi:cation transporter-like permease